VPISVAVITVIKKFHGLFFIDFSDTDEADVWC